MSFSFRDSLPLAAAAQPSLVHRIWRKLRHRWHWRASRSRHARLTLVSQFFPPDFAATGQLLDDLTIRLASQGLQIQVLTGMPAYAFNRSDAEKIEFQHNRCIRRTSASRIWPQRIRGRAINGILFCTRIGARLLRYARRGDLILYTTEPAYLPLMGWMLHWLTRTPYLVLVYDLYPDVLVGLNVLPATHWLVRLWTKLNFSVYKDAQQLIVLSEPIANKLQQQSPELDSKITIIPSWADPTKIYPRAKNKNWFALRHHLENCFTVLYSGNQGRCHDLVTLMAAAMLLRNRSDIRFVFVGKGAQEKRLHELAHDWGLNNCLFLPYQNLDDLPYSLSSADLAVVSLAIEAEGLVAPSKLYGHLAAGTPIAAITPANSYLRELVEAEGCGRWFANGEADSLAEWILHLHQHPEDLRRMGTASRKLLMRTATPELITAHYWHVIKPHLPSTKTEAYISSQSDESDRHEP